MHWSKIRQAYPKQWLVVEALEAHTTKNNATRSFIGS